MARGEVEVGSPSVAAGGRPLAFEALYYGDLVRVVNPHGDVGLITLWSPMRTVERKLAEIAPELLDPSRSRVAVVANLYGDGMHAMFCNLLWNPQIRHLVALGEDLGLGAADDIEALLGHGLVDAEILGKPVKRIAGRERVFPAVGSFDDARLREQLSFRAFGKLSRPDLAADLPGYVERLPTLPPAGERVRVDIPMAVADDYSFQPSEVTAHQVVRRRPLEAWRELVVRTVRFGRPVELAGGPRIELLNARVVITEPVTEPRESLAEYGFELDRFERYGERILEPELPEGISYTYGNRLRGYFPQRTSATDSLQTVVETLRANPASRRAYVTTWDMTTDLTGVTESTPCLVTLFFRRTDDGQLSLTATYRAHNLLTAWLENVYGLMAIQRFVGERVGMETGPISVISHSLGIDPRSPRYELARELAAHWRTDNDVDPDTGKSILREDPNGYFVVSVDQERGVMVAEHRYGGVLVKRYEGTRAESIEREVAADMAISLISHAMWLGRELTRKERQLRGAV
jgi:thymidylate synthase